MSRPAGGAHRASRRAAHLVLLGLAIYLAVLAHFFRTTGGLVGRYAIQGANGEEIPVQARVDPSLDFPVPQRIDAAYIFHWDLKRFGFPANMPPIAVRWRGLLRVPEAGAYGFAVEAQGAAALRLDGETLEIGPDVVVDRSLASGLHPIEVDYRLTEGEAKLVLRWQPPGGALQAIPSKFLAPDRAAIERGRSRRLYGWLWVAGGAGLLLGAALAARSRTGRAARLLERLEEERPRLALGAILMLAAVVRLDDYALVPFHHETADEYQHAWEGWTLLHHGTPASWSTFPDRYPLDQTHDFRWFGDRYVLVWPYFDHPPLFSLLVGVVNSLAAAPSSALPPGSPDYLLCTLPVMRLVPIALSLLGLLLLVRLARVYGSSERAALLGALIYAILPVIVLAHRLVKGESLLAVLFMGAILAAHRHAAKGGARSLLLAGLLSSLAIWTKATGVAVPLVVVLILWSSRARRAAWAVAGATAAALALYLVYAAANDFGIFLKVIEAQATTKWVSPDALQDLLSGKVVTKYFGRGTYLWLLLAGACVALRPARRLLMPIAVYVTLLALTADQRVIYGWYRIPIYPFLCVAAGVYLEEMLAEADLPRSFPFAVTAVSAALLVALPPGLAQSKPAMAGFAALALLPFLPRYVAERRATRALASAATWGLLIVFLVACLATDGDLLASYAATRGIR